MSTEPIKVKWRPTHLKKHPNFTGCLIDEDDDIAWYKNGKCHRENGPALELASGSKAWFKNGNCHRENGPAVEYADGDKRWYLYGKEYAEQEHRIAMRHMKLKLLDIDQHSL